MANANLVLAVSRGLRPPLIYGAVANARAQVNQLVINDQIADRRTLVTLAAVDAVQSPSSVDLLV